MARVHIQEPIEEPVAQQQTEVVAPAQEPSRRAVNFLSRKNIISGAIVVVALLVIFMLFSLMQDKNKLKSEVNKLSNGQTSAASNEEKYQTEVAKLIEVPEGVKPQVKTPTEAEITQLVAGNPIYKNTKTGDAFLIYTYPDKSIFVVIYRPSTNKVILATLGSQPSVPAGGVKQ